MAWLFLQRMTAIETPYWILVTWRPEQALIATAINCLMNVKTVMATTSLTALTLLVAPALIVSRMASQMSASLTAETTTATRMAFRMCASWSATTAIATGWWTRATLLQERAAIPISLVFRMNARTVIAMERWTVPMLPQDSARIASPTSFRTNVSLVMLRLRWSMRTTTERAMETTVFPGLQISSG